MTIIEPHKHNPYRAYVIYAGIGFCGIAVLGIFLYNANVRLKHVVSVQERTLQQLEASNAELRNHVYAVLDLRNLTKLIQDYNLVSDKNPSYIEANMLVIR
ncbi:MAG: hypothetical protein Q8R26_03830 [bacterium]|nr:hypothetical protein [bacterium]